MTTASLSFRTSVLPWALAHEDEERFRKLFLVIVGASLVFGIALRFITLPEHAREACFSPPRPGRPGARPAALPPRSAQLLLKKPAPPPPPPVEAKVEKPRP